MLEKLKRLQYGARIKLYSGDQLQVVEVAGRRTQLLRGGRGAPLLYLHTAIGETNWMPFHQSLSRQFDVIAPAHPGFALSAVGDEPDDIEDIVFHYLDLLSQMRLDRVHIVGASLGGWIAAEFALRYPDRVDRLVLVDCAGLRLEEVLPNLEAFDSESAIALRQRLLHDPDCFAGELLFPEVEDARSTGLVAPATIASTWSAAGCNPRLLARLHRISRPTMVLWGADDAIYPIAYAKAFHEAIHGSVLHLIEQCGHLPMFEQEAKFVTAVTRFLKADATSFANGTA